MGSHLKNTAGQSWHYEIRFRAFTKNRSFPGAQGNEAGGDRVQQGQTKLLQIRLKVRLAYCLAPGRFKIQASRVYIAVP